MTEQKQFRPFEDLSLEAILYGAKESYDVALASKKALDERSKFDYDDNISTALISDSKTFIIEDKGKLLNELKIAMYGFDIDERTLAYIVSKTEQLQNGDITMKARKIARDFMFIKELSDLKKFDLDGETIALLSIHQRAVTKDYTKGKITKNLRRHIFDRFNDTRSALYNAFGEEILAEVGEKRFNFLSAMYTISDYGMTNPIDMKETIAREVMTEIATEFDLQVGDETKLFSSTLYFMSGINGRTQGQGIETMKKLVENPTVKSRLSVEEIGYLSTRKDSYPIKAYIRKRDSQ